MSRTRLVFLIGYVALIFALSTRAYMKPPGPEFHYRDKVAHLIEYSVLGTLLVSAFGARSGRARMLTFAFLVTIGASVAATDEMIQGVVPGRSKDILDWMADLIGVSIGVSVLLFSRLGARGGGAAVRAGDGGAVT